MPPDVVEQPVVTPAPQDVAVASPVVAPAPAADAVVAAEPQSKPAEAVEAAPKAEPHPADVPSLLEEVGKKAEEAAKPEDKKVEAAAEPVAAPQPAPAEIEWDFKLPDTLKADDAAMGRFRGNLNELLRPKEGESPSHAANRLLGMHAEAMAAYDQQLRAEQVRVFNETRATWRRQIMADPDIGGAGHETAKAAIARVRDTLISSAKYGTEAYKRDVKEVNDFMRITGAGDHPAFWKMLHRAVPYIDEPAMPTAQASPPPDAGRRPGRRQLYAE